MFFADSNKTLFGMSIRSDRISALACVSQFRIGELRVEPQRLRLIRAGDEIALEPRMMELLVALCERAGEVLSAEQLLIEIWQGTFYGDNPVHKTMAQLRRRLGDDSRAPRFIETIRKRGYRFIARVVFPEGYRPAPVARGRWDGASPYVGLHAFTSDHAPVFYGRSRATADLMIALRNQIEAQKRFVLVSGASGCGKTSLVCASVLPLLTRSGGFQGMEAVASSRFDLGLCRGGDLLLRLAEALCEWTIDGRAIFLPTELPMLVDQLRSGAESLRVRLDDAWSRRLDRSPDPKAHPILLLVIDHAEAVVAVPAMTAEDRSDFATALTLLCGLARVAVVAITRSDFFPRLLEAVPCLAELKSNAGHIDLFPPLAGEISQIIRSPAALAGLHFEEEAISAIRLDDVLRDAVARQPDALPLLQHTLHMLYEGRTADGQLSFRTYRELGGLEGALAHRAEQAFAGLPPQAAAELGRVFSALVVVQPDSDTISARAVFLSALGSPDALQLVEAFVRVRLFVAELRDGEPVFCVAHEALLRQWPRATAWIVENRGLLQALQRLQRAAQHWRAEQFRLDHLLNPGRPLEEAQEVVRRLATQVDPEDRAFLRASERQHQRRRGWRLVGVAALVLSTCVAVVLGLQADRAQRRAELRRDQAQHLVSFMLGELADRLRPLGNLKLLDGVGGAVLGYLEGLPQADMQESELVSHAQALRTVGEVLVGQGRFDEAEAAFVRADEATRQALKLAPKSQYARAESGSTAYWLGYLAFRDRRLDLAQTHWEAYLRAAEDLIARSPDDPRALLELSYALNNLGTLAHKRQLLDEASSLFARSVHLKRELLKRSPDDRSLQFEMIDSLSWLSSTQDARGLMEDAAAGYRQQIGMLRELLQGDPDADAWRRRLATSLLRSSHLALDLGRIAQAESDVNESLDLLVVLTTQRPDNRVWRRDLGHAQAQAGLVARFLGQPDRARVQLRAAQSTLAPLMSLDRSLPEWRLLDALVRVRLAQLHATPEALLMASPALATLEAMHVERSDDMQVSAALAYTLTWRGDELHTAGDGAAAREHWLRARALLAEAAATSRDRSLLDSWVRVHHRLGEQVNAAAALRWLQAAGYNHPGFIEFYQPAENGDSLP